MGGSKSTAITSIQYFNDLHIQVQDPFQLRVAVAYGYIGHVRRLCQHLLGAILSVHDAGDVQGRRGDKEFASWMGLAPSVHQSGERTRVGGVSGPGNKRLQ